MRATHIILRDQITPAARFQSQILGSAIGSRTDSVFEGSGKAISGRLEYGLLEGYLWWLRHAHIKVQSQHLV